MNNSIGKEIFKDKIKYFQDKFEKNKNSSQVNFLGDVNFWAMLDTINSIENTPKRTFIHDAVKEKALKEFPEWFNIMEDEEKERDI